MFGVGFFWDGHLNSSWFLTSRWYNVTQYKRMILLIMFFYRLAGDIDSSFPIHLEEAGDFTYLLFRKQTRLMELYHSQRIVFTFCPDEQFCWTLLVIKMSLNSHFFGIIFTAQLGTQKTSNCLTRQKVIWIADGKNSLHTLMICDKAFLQRFSADLLQRKKRSSSLDMLFR